MEMLPTLNNIDGYCFVCSISMWKGYNFHTITFDNSEIKWELCARCLGKLKTFLIEEKMKQNS